jgi:hypothetical protein
MGHVDCPSLIRARTFDLCPVSEPKLLKADSLARSLMPLSIRRKSGASASVRKQTRVGVCQQRQTRSLSLHSPFN